MPVDGAPYGVRRGRIVTNLDLARLQFASTSIYHFLFVPVTIGLAFLVALLQTTWHRRGDEAYLRLIRSFGTLLVINIANRRGHGLGPGVPVRHELVGVLAVRRRRVRSAAGDPPLSGAAVLIFGRPMAARSC